jgi:hypothetical protein
MGTGKSEKQPKNENNPSQDRKQLAQLSHVFSSIKQITYCQIEGYFFIHISCG